jgi:hypothetical protein
MGRWPDEKRSWSDRRNDIHSLSASLLARRVVCGDDRPSCGRSRRIVHNDWSRSLIKPKTKPRMTHSALIARHCSGHSVHPVIPLKINRLHVEHKSGNDSMRARSRRSLWA